MNLSSYDNYIQPVLSGEVLGECQERVSVWRMVSDCSHKPARIWVRPEVRGLAKNNGPGVHSQWRFGNPQKLRFSAT